MIDYDTLFVFVDDFCQGFDPWYHQQLIQEGTRKRRRQGHLNLSEVLTIVLAYHQSGKACFQYFYFDLLRQGRGLFPSLTSYSRFVTLIKRAFPALLCLLKSLFGEVTEYLFIDSTPMTVCKNLRISRHQVFKECAARGHTSTGWFYGMKLHMLVNTQGEIVRLTITPGNCDDRTPVRDMMGGIKTKLIGDKGYLSQELFDDLFSTGTTLITKVRKNMKDRFITMTDKFMLKNRGFIETIFSFLKSLGTLIHHRLAQSDVCSRGHHGYPIAIQEVYVIHHQWPARSKLFFLAIYKMPHLIHHHDATFSLRHRIFDLFTLFSHPLQHRHI